MRMFDFGEGDHLAQLASLSFDASVLEIFMTLLSGATLHLVSSDVVVSGADLGELLREEAISALTLTPSLLNTIPEEGLIDLRLIVVGGEPCSAETATRWGPGRRFYNVYAPTEATIYATIFECSGAHRASPPIGRPIANMRIYLLDSNLQVVPIGGPGQLRVGGSGLARGYLRRPEMTAERFIPNPFAVEPGERLYTTGDVGRYLPDGNLEFMGRTDDQVKVRGYRIELGEIEAVCLEHPQVHEVAVVAREDQGGDKRLVAYYASQAEQPLTPGALREFLKSKLPDYMAPARLVLMRSLPKMPTGKIDRKALPQEARPDAGEDFVGPRNPVEEAVAKIWSDALGREQVSVHDNFFDIDGHSLMAARVVYRLRDRFGIELPIRDFFESPTVADLALKISECDGIKGEAAAPEISRQPRGGKKIKDLLDQLNEAPCDSAQPSAGLDATK